MTGKLSYPLTVARRQSESERIKKTRSQLILIDSQHAEGIKKNHPISLSEWGERIQQKYVSFVFLASIYVCMQLESTSQQATMPLSDMADLHVSEFPAGEGA